MQTHGNESSSPGESPKPRRTIFEILTEGDEIDRAIQRAVREALIEHKRLGHSIVVWQDGKVVEIPPDQIPV